ncbi:MAG TPA: branched-chain amino acid ABC transporter permease [Dehalococcoidia bacterium]|nr:branched-chain amino acid ABC transporter permease [Dehalococcoidia bacterium]
MAVTNAEAGRLTRAGGRLRAAPGWQQAALLALLVLALVAVPPLKGGILSQRLALYLIFGLLGLSVALITGYARLFNIGVGATFGVSAYAVAIATQHGVSNPLLLPLIGIGAGLVVSVLFGIYAIAAAGIQYMMLTFLTTLAFFEIPNWATKLTGGDNGLVLQGGLRISFGQNPIRGHGFYYLVLGVTLFVCAVCWYALSSQFGRAIRAIGQNPLRAAAMGYEVSRYRMALTLLSGFVAATGGWLLALDNQFVSQDLVGLNYSLNGLLYALVGGVDSILGPLIGAAGFRYISETISRHSSDSQLFIGIALIAIVFLMPDDGVVGLYRRARARGLRGSFAGLYAYALGLLRMLRSGDEAIEAEPAGLRPTEDAGNG